MQQDHEGREAVTDPIAIEAAFAADEEAEAAPRSQRLEFAGPEPVEPAHQLRAALERLVAVCKAMDCEIDGERPSEEEYRVALAEAEAALGHGVQAEPKRCEHCDDTGDVHGFDGEWRGVCNCPAGQAYDKPATTTNGPLFT